MTTPNTTQQDTGNPTTAGDASGNDGFTVVPAAARAVTPAHGSLTPNQRRFLSLRLSHATDLECANATGVDDSTVRRWKQQPAFAAAYQQLLDTGIEEWANAERRRLLGKALLSAEDALDATSTVYLKDGTALGEQPDWKARADGRQAILRANGLWNPQERGGGGTDALTAFMGRMADIIEGKQPQPPTTIEGSSRPAD